MLSENPAIKTFDLTRAFGNLVAVNNLNLNVPRASVYGFLGPNGAGKTTTNRMLLGLIRPDKGQIELMGKPLAQNRIALLQRVGALVETPSLYGHLTGRENLELTRRLLGCGRQQIDRVLSIVKLEKAASRKAKEYSLGMLQRLGLALALLNEPALLILDEPTNGLDPAGIHEMRDLIIRLPREFGITVFMSSHLLSEVEQMATHIGIVSHGRLIFQGSLSSLQAQRHESLHLGVNKLNEAEKLITAAGWTAERKSDCMLDVAVRTREDVIKLNSLLVRNQVEVFHLSLEHPSLEDTFLELTANQPVKERIYENAAARA
jgi:ABC-2 type transport system ATP-binding protein